jgi:hypothetical protein
MNDSEDGYQYGSSIIKRDIKGRELVIATDNTGSKRLLAEKIIVVQLVPDISNRRSFHLINLTYEEAKNLHKFLSEYVDEVHTFHEH